MEKYIWLGLWIILAISMFYLLHRSFDKNKQSRDNWNYRTRLIDYKSSNPNKIHIDQKYTVPMVHTLGGVWRPRATRCLMYHTYADCQWIGYNNNTSTVFKTNNGWVYYIHLRG